MRIPLSAPDITEAEIAAVTEVLRTPWLSRGPRLAEFEQAVASRVGVAHAIATSSGTAALHLVVRACGLRAGDEVVTSPFSFMASVNALLYEGITPVFVDVDPAGLGLDPARIEAALSPRTRAILVVHVFGRPARMAEILAVARRHRLTVLEDACEALGAEVADQSAGTLGECGTFAFYPNKQITTGEGGMIVTDDPRRARLCRSLRNHGRDDDGDEHTRLGYNYRLSELACALGVAQMRRLDDLLALRQRAAERYDRRLTGRDGLLTPDLRIDGARISWFVYVVRLSPQLGREDRDWIAAQLRRRGIGVGRYFEPLHLAPYVRAALGQGPGSFPLAEAAAARTLALPFFPRISEAEIDEVAGTLLELVDHRLARTRVSA